METENYVIVRRNYDENSPEYQVVTVTPGNDPLYGYGSWSLYAGPFSTVEEAEQAMPTED